MAYTADSKSAVREDVWVQVPLPANMDCRSGCGACCIAPSISTPLPGYSAGKPAGLPCPCLDAELRCTLYGRPERPAVCSSLAPSPEMCGERREAALAYLAALESATAPG